MAERPATDADWLAEGRRIGPPPDDLVEVRRRLHGIVTNVLTPARYRVTGRIAMRWTPGGLGTPFFERDGQFTQVRLEADELVVQVGDDVTRHELTTIGDAVKATIGESEPDMRWTRDLDLHDVPEDLPPDTDIAVPAGTMRWFGDWFGLAFSVLSRLRADEVSVDASEPQLWPEHLDPAIEVLEDRRRAAYGFSPGDASIPEPYVYVAPWYPDDVGVVQGQGPWNADGFTGAVVRVTEVVEVGDQGAHLLDWLRVRRDILRG